MSFVREYVVRWSEIDLNMHLTSSAYVKYITDTRMEFFESNGFGLKEMEKFMMGPIVLFEKSYYFKEIRPREKITVKMTNAGASEDGTRIRLEQRIYDGSGRNCFLAYTLFAFLDLRTRKLATPLQELSKILDGLPRSKQYHILSKEELRDADAFPD